MFGIHVSLRQNIIPYLSSFLGPLKKAVIDPNPDVRRVAARAMGSLVTGVGEEPLEDLLPWLLETMQSDASSVERSGGAQVCVVDVACYVL